MKTIDINKYIGQRFNKFVVKEFSRVEACYVGGRRRYKYYFMCDCDCGNRMEIEINKLRTGSIKSCKKCSGNDWVGRRFGFLTVTEVEEKAYTDKHGKFHNTRVKVKCDCGKERSIYVSAIINKTSPKRTCGSRACKLKYKEMIAEENKENTEIEKAG